MALGALIGAGGSLLGGLFGRSSQRKAEARQREYDLPVNVRARYEQAGINPLLAFGGGVVGQSQPVQATNHMGSAIADAALMVGNKLTGRAQEKLQLEQLRLQNQKLEKELTQQTLRPATRGMYQTGATPSVGGSVMKPAIKPEPMTFSHRPMLRGIRPIDERPPVELYSPLAGKHVPLHPDLAARLDLKPGDAIMMEDVEGIGGDAAGSVLGAAALVNEAVGAGDAFGGKGLLPRSGYRTTDDPDPRVGLPSPKSSPPSVSDPRGQSAHKPTLGLRSLLNSGNRAPSAAGWGNYAR